MDEQKMNRRQILGGVAASATGAGLVWQSAMAAAPAPNAGAPVFPDQGTHQAPPITDVKDKVAYITGGSSGIGLGIARALHEAGAKVILGNYNDEQFAEALKSFPANDPRVATVVHDVMVRDTWNAKADEIEKKFGPVHILVNNAGVGPFATTTGGSNQDWDWCMGVNFWGPLYGARTFVPRMMAHGQGSHIVTTSSTDGVLLGTTGIYAVSKLAVTGLMEQLRHELRTTNIGTSNLVPGMTSTNIGRSETYRPEALRNAPAAGAAAPGGAPRGGGGAARGGAPGAAARGGAAPAPAAPVSTLWQRPQQPLDVGRIVVNGIINNDMWIFPAPEYRVGVLARGYAMYESMVDFSPMPENIAAGMDRYYRTPIYVQEIAHRRATRKRSIPGV